MQVSLTATGGLERRLEVAIPAAQVDGEVAQRLTKISRTARLKGFRPGKAPIAVIRHQYGEQVHGEVINDLALERPIANVSDADLDAMLDTLRKQRPAFNEVARGAAVNDRVVVDFVGKIDGAEFDG